MTTSRIIILEDLYFISILFICSRFYKKYNKIPMAEIAHQMASQENYRDLPEANAI